ncbi:MAG: hypothetical protein ACRDHC_04660 [Actinomycetota bacterium]
MSEKVLVTVELRFTTEDDPKQLGERVREAVSMVVGRERLEEFRVRVIRLAPPKKPRAV